MAKVIDDLILYQKSLVLAQTIFALVDVWNLFHKNTVGAQLVRSANSVSANISEGYGRYFYRDRRMFLFYARGSLFETRTHVQLARRFNLISEDKELALITMADELLKILNGYIKSIDEKI